jgi:hypothetical protein
VNPSRNVIMCVTHIWDVKLYVLTFRMLEFT